MTIQRQPKIRSILEPFGDFPQHDGVQRWSRKPPDLCSSKPGSHTGEKEERWRGMAQGRGLHVMPVHWISCFRWCNNCMGRHPLYREPGGRSTPLQERRRRGGGQGGMGQGWPMRLPPSLQTLTLGEGGSPMRMGHKAIVWAVHPSNMGSPPGGPRAVGCCLLNKILNISSLINIKYHLFNISHSGTPSGFIRTDFGPTRNFSDTLSQVLRCL